MSIGAAVLHRAKPTTQKFNAPGYWDGPVWVEGGESSATIDAAVFPISGRETQELPEGVRVGAKYQVFTLANVKGGDRIAVNEGDLEVIFRQDWPSYNWLIIGGPANDGS